MILMRRAKHAKKILKDGSGHFVLPKLLVSTADCHIVSAASLRKTHVSELLLAAWPKFPRSPLWN